MALRLLFALATVALAGCSSSTPPPPQIVVSLHSDVKIPKDFDTVAIKIQQKGVTLYDVSYAAGPDGARIPGTFAITAGSDLANPIKITISGRTGGERGTDRVIREAVVPFDKSRAVLLRMPLRFSCFEKSDCGEGQTCAGGACTPTTVDPSALPTYRDDLVFGKENAVNGDGCFDTIACVPQSVKLTPSATACEFDLVGATEAGRVLDAKKPITVVLRRNTTTAAKELGFCTAGVCQVAIDNDATEGWVYADPGKTRVKISDGLCARLKAGHFDEVAAVSTCGTKAANVPDCRELGKSTLPGP